MALIKKTSIEEVVAAADMVDVVQGRTQLRKSGARWVGLCPFHSEKTPSFGINPVEKLFYCHGCHKGGDLITFVRETEGLDFAQAVEWLADRTGTQLEYEETSPAQEARRKRRDRLESLLEDAASFYSRYLWDTAAGESARAYLSERGLTEEQTARHIGGIRWGPPGTPPLGELLTTDGLATMAFGYTRLDIGVIDGAIDGTTLAGAETRSRVARPVLVVAADDEAGAAFTTGDEAGLVSSQPDVEVRRIAGSGHRIHDMRDHRDAFAGHLRGFLDVYAG